MEHMSVLGSNASGLSALYIENTRLNRQNSIERVRPVLELVEFGAIRGMLRFDSQHVQPLFTEIPTAGGALVIGTFLWKNPCQWRRMIQLLQVDCSNVLRSIKESSNR